MPLIASSILPKPKDWNEFEDICLSACKLKWGNPNLTRHGRQGQAQQGIDIYGDDNLGRKVGIQCKNTSNSISKSIINEEISNAENFKPEISSLFIATTSPPDVQIQKYTREISEQRLRNNQFAVGILFWTDIEQDLSKDKREIARFFPQFFTIQPSATPIHSHRDRDISNITHLLNHIDIESINFHLDSAPRHVEIKFIEHVQFFQKIRSNPLFHLYDKNLSRHLNKWLDKWFQIRFEICIAPYESHDNSTEKYSFIMPMGNFRNKEEETTYHELKKMFHDLIQYQNKFCDFIHTNYQEIDLRSTSTAAQKLYAKI